MATIPVDDLQITEHFGPHLSAMAGVRLSTSAEPERLVKTHCCFCGQQCGVQLKVLDNEVIGFEPWEEFPFNRGMLCPKGVKRYLQGAHPDRLTTALRRNPSSPNGFSPIAYDDAIAKVASEIGRLPVMTYETVLWETPARRATSLLVNFGEVIDTYRRCVSTPYRTTDANASDSRTTGRA